MAGIDIDLVPGEFTAIMGASGSGKTTPVFTLLGGLDAADGGSIRFAGQDLIALSDAAVTVARGKHIGVVFQAYNLMPTLTALDNVALPLLAGSSRAKARAAARERLEAVGLGQRANHRPSLLSGGEQQRVAVGKRQSTTQNLCWQTSRPATWTARTQAVCQLAIRN